MISAEFTVGVWQDGSYVVSLFVHSDTPRFSGLKGLLGKEHFQPTPGLTLNEAFIQELWPLIKSRLQGQADPDLTEDELKQVQLGLAMHFCTLPHHKIPTIEELVEFYRDEGDE